MRIRPLFFQAVSAFCAFTILCGLGFWQVERKAWKESLIAAVNERIAAAPAPLPAPRDWPRLAPETYEFRRVTVRLQFPQNATAFVFTGGSSLRSDIKAPGYFVFAPARIPSGETIVVNLGFAPDKTIPDIAGTREITGFLRWPERPNWFVDEHDSAGETWFVRDHEAIATFLKWGTVAPFYIDQESPVPPGGIPKPGPIAVRFPNNHFGYALTWFGLAAALAGVFGIWLRRQVRGRQISRSL
ncbi:MAG TPA: SURF1 family protein [Pseudorhodoplanes sp.]|nr:SURF1 family protein [Pseudorhodoplanes sp.]